MRKPILLSLLSVFPLVHASDTGIPGSKSATIPIINVMGRPMSLQEFVKLRLREYEKLTGKKLKFKEKVGLKVFQWKLKGKIKSGATPEQLALGRKSLLFGILGYGFSFLSLLFPPFGLVGIGFAIAGLVLGIKSVKGNSNGPESWVSSSAASQCLDFLSVLG